MSGNLAYFVIREIIYAFLRRGKNLDETDIITCVLAELKSSKIIESMDKTNLDFTVVYCIFDLLSSLGFVNVRLERAQKCLSWLGFPGFHERTFGALTKAAHSLPPKDVPAKMEEGGDQPPIPNLFDSFTTAFFSKMLSKPDNIVTYAEYQQIANQFLYAGTVSLMHSFRGHREGEGS